MDSSNNHQHQHQHHLGMNKMSKNIRKNPIHHPNFAHHKPTHPPPPPQPQVYNISKNDFRTVVQQLTGTPSRDPANPNPPSLPPHPKPPSMRLQRIRPPPLTPISRHPPPPNQPYFHPRPVPGPAWADTPVSAYMRYLESSLLTSDSSRHPGPAFPSPRGNSPLPSPGSQFPLPSPSSYLNLLSPRSPYPLLSPGFQHPPPFTPNFFSSPMASQQGILGPGPQPPPSPGSIFPPSPSWFSSFWSPRWKDL